MDVKMKRVFVTLGDKRYVRNIGCLIDSVRSHFTVPYEIHVVCLDKETEDFISARRSGSDVVVHPLSELFEDFEIRSFRLLPPSREATSNAQASNKDPQHVQFCWTLAAVSTSWLMERMSCDVTYVDSDIYFFGDIEPFFAELGAGSVGVVRHRIPYLPTSGEYNVGIVHFKFDPVGRAVLRTWRDNVTRASGPYIVHYGVCGDQRYLELLRGMFPSGVVVVDKNFGHLAPWSVTQHAYVGGKILWEGRLQDLVYFHFAHFNAGRSGYSASYNNEWIWGDPLKVDPFVNDLYDRYYAAMKGIDSELVALSRLRRGDMT